MTGGLLHAPLLAALAQAALPLAPPAALPGREAAYRVGPGDVLDVQVAGRPEAARLATVQTTGAIHLTPLGEVAVSGLTPAEIGIKLTSLWSRTDPRRPEVGVWVKEYQSQFVWVAGEVNRPGRKPLRGRTRLIDVLVAGGGFSPRASGEVVVERRDGTFEDGTTTRRFRFGGNDPSPAELAALETLLRTRDVVTASATRYVTVSGAVTRPGRYALKVGTLTEALDAAGGVTKFAGRRVLVNRHDADTRSAQVLDVDLREVEDGRLPDPVLRSEDEVVVKASLL